MTADLSDTAPLAASSFRANEDLDGRIDKALTALIAEQKPDGHFVFELEADATIPAEYVLLQHFLGESTDAALEAKIGAYLRRVQGAHGGWPLFRDGAFDVSASVKAYFALKMIGDDPAAEHMRRAREAILVAGGAAAVNVFTRSLLALYGNMSWRAVPLMPPEIMLLPRWFPFHLSKISYWARTTLVPLLVLQALKPKARNPRGVRIDELFLEPPMTIGPPKKAPHQRWSWFLFFRAIDTALRAFEPLFPKELRDRAIKAAVSFCNERLNGEDGLGAIFPPMANVVMVFDVLGYPPDHPDRAVARRALDKLLVIREHEAYCQPCVSPVWDTALACHALLEAGGDGATAQARKALDWLPQGRRLITVATDCDLSGHVAGWPALEALVLREVDRPGLLEFYQRFGFKLWRKELEDELGASAPAPASAARTQVPTPSTAPVPAPA